MNELATTAQLAAFERRSVERFEAFEQRFVVQLGTVERELNEVRRQQGTNDDRWRKAAQSTAVRTRLWVAGITALGVVVVAAITAVSNHSYAVARQQVQEMNRQDWLTQRAELMAHDELLIKRTLDERDRRIDALILRAK